MVYRPLSSRLVRRLVALLIGIAIGLLGVVLPPPLLGEGVDTLSPAERRAAADAKAVFWSIVDFPIGRPFAIHVKVLDVRPLPSASVPPCVSPDGRAVAYGACIPEGSRTPICAGTWHPALQVHMRAYTWAGLPLSEALIRCGPAGRVL